MTCGVPPFATWNAPACRATSRWELQATGTEAVYRRYDIVSEKDMQLAASRMDEFFEAQRKDQKEKDLEAKRGKSGTMKVTQIRKLLKTW